MTWLPVKSVANYYQTPGARDLAHNLKKGDTHAIEKMALEMSDLLPEDAVLIPIPSRNGHATTSLKLALALEEITGAHVDNILTGKERDSFYALKKEEIEINDSFFGYHLTSEPSPGNLVLIDGVCDTGKTGIAAAKSFDKDIELITHSSHFPKGIGVLKLGETRLPSPRQEQTFDI